MELCSALQCRCISQRRSALNSLQSRRLLTVRPSMQVKAVPAAESCNVAHPSLTSFGSMRAHASASLAPAPGAWRADSAHARAASAQPEGRSSDVAHHTARACPPPGQGPSWRQLISRPLYPEKLPAAGESQGPASSPLDLAPFAAHTQGGTGASGPSCPHCRASLGEVPSSSNGRAAVKGRAWSAELCQGLSGMQCSGAAAPKALVPGAAAEAPRASAAKPANAPRPAQHAKRPESALIRGRNSYRRAPVEHSDQPALGKENVKQRSEEQARSKQAPDASNVKQRSQEEQTRPEQAPDALQSRASQPRSAPLASAFRDESQPHGPARSAHASTPSMPRPAMRGTLITHVYGIGSPARFDRGYL